MSTRPRIRSIKPEMWQDEKVGDLSLGARLLFIGLITMADDEGRFRALPSLMLGHVFPYDLDAARRLDGWKREIAAAGLIVEYESGGKPYGVLPGFARHQRINRPTRSTLPGPPFTESSVIDHGTRREQDVSDHGAITERSSPHAGARSGADRIGSGSGKEPPQPPASGGSGRRRDREREMNDLAARVADYVDRHPVTGPMLEQWAAIRSAAEQQLAGTSSLALLVDLHPHSLDGDTLVLGAGPGAVQMTSLIEQSKAAGVLRAETGKARVRVLPCGCEIEGAVAA